MWRGIPRSVNCAAIVALGVALMSVPATVRAADDGLGRLFFTPQQRAQIDRARTSAAGKLSSADAPAAAPATSSTAPKAADAQHVQFSGVVLRGDGKHTYWVNNQAQGLPSAQPQGNNTAQLRGTTLKINTDGLPVELKPGQYYDLRDQRVRDNYERTPAAPAAATTENVGTAPVDPADEG